MSIAQLYDKIAGQYAEVDYFNIISTALFQGIQQLQATSLLFRPDLWIIDMGAGDGKLLQLIHELNPTAQLTGVDISNQMLKLATTRLPQITTIRSGIANIHRRLTSHQFDLVLASFVCSYVGLPMLLQQSNYLLNRQGYFLILTTTGEAFRGIQHQIAALNDQFNPFKKLFYYWIEKTVANIKVPESHPDIAMQAENYGYQIVEYERLTTPIFIKNIAEATAFAESGGWGLSLLDYKILPPLLLKRLAQCLARYLSFPIHDQVVVESILLRKQ